MLIYDISQVMPADAAKLRQQLERKLGQLDRILGPGFERDPVFPGRISVSRHRCGGAGCRCNDGHLHEAVRLAIGFKDGTAYRCLDEEGLSFWKPRSEAYRRIRESQRSFRKWQKEVLELLDAIERARRSTKGLSDKDRGRPLR